jgi:hypothetical protein
MVRVACYSQPVTYPLLKIQYLLGWVLWIHGTYVGRLKNRHVLARSFSLEPPNHLFLVEATLWLESCAARLTWCWALNRKPTDVCATARSAKPSVHPADRQRTPKQAYVIQRLARVLCGLMRALLTHRSRNLLGAGPEV